MRGSAFFSHPERGERGDREKGEKDHEVGRNLCPKGFVQSLLQARKLKTVCLKSVIDICKNTKTGFLSTSPMRLTQRWL